MYLMKRDYKILSMEKEFCKLHHTYYQERILLPRIILSSKLFYISPKKLIYIRNIER